MGDSFAFGDEVDDRDTLPAHLQELFGRRVINAGVFGYGLDQSVLRAERHLETLRPAVVVLQFVGDDVNRTALSNRTGAEKPWFDLVDGELILCNVPTSPARPKLSEIGLFRMVFGYSYLVDWTMRLHREERWYLGRWPSVAVHHDTERALAVSCALVGRLQRKVAPASRLVLLSEYLRPAIHYGERLPETVVGRRLATCARDQGIEVVDVFDDLRAEMARDPRGYAGLWIRTHLSSAGNRHVAERVAAHLKLPTCARGSI